MKQEGCDEILNGMLKFSLLCLPQGQNSARKYGVFSGASKSSKYKIYRGLMRQAAKMRGRTVCKEH
ncbi:hypothetical protein [uncultured Campylobacter sp.]|uniref:hypothetical protein n=1 Tax=uncultured Campylobacter sp. TaxID=218934 RepID=UPI002630343F|nr:hypothetical protein [uncultured Campylobacter sp.]